MRIALINPPHRSGIPYMKEIGRCGRKSIAGELWPQTGLATVAAFLRKHGHEVLLRDSMALGETFPGAVGSVAPFSPQLVVVHTVTPTYNSDIAFCRELKRVWPESPIALIGTHAAAMGADAVRNQPAEVAVSDEGERPLAELANRLESTTGGHWEPEALRDLPGLWVKQPDQSVPFGGPGPLVEDLSSLPFPLRESLPNDRYRMPFFRNRPFATVICSRGCPWDCTFCRSGITWGDKVRSRTTESVIGEIQEIRDRYEIRHLAFMTDTFTYSKSWVLDLCEKMRTRTPDIRWVCNSRVDTIDEERLEAMKGAGCEVISYGVESADPGILKDCRKGIDPEASRRAIRLTQEKGILAFAYFVLGLPGETRETIRKTVDFSISAGPDYAFFHVAIPFPGTELYEQAKRNGWLESRNWDDFEENGGGVMHTEALSAGELREAQKAAHRRFYMRPSRILKELGGIRSFGDLCGKISAGFHVLRSSK